MSILQVNSKCDEIQKFFRKLHVQTEFVRPFGQHPNVFSYNLKYVGNRDRFGGLFCIGWIDICFFTTDPIYKIRFNFGTSTEWNRRFKKDNKTLLSFYKTKDFKKFKSSAKCALKGRFKIDKMLKFFCLILKKKNEKNKNFF